MLGASSAFEEVRMTGMLLLVLLTAIARVASAESDEARLVGPFANVDHPQALIDRPLTLPAGRVEGELGATFAELELPEHRSHRK
jgi:hypothetical protein